MITHPFSFHNYAKIRTVNTNCAPSIPTINENHSNEKELQFDEHKDVDVTDEQKTMINNGTIKNDKIINESSANSNKINNFDAINSNEWKQKTQNQFQKNFKEILFKANATLDQIQQYTDLLDQKKLYNAFNVCNIFLVHFLASLCDNLF